MKRKVRFELFTQPHPFLEGSAFQRKPSHQAIFATGTFLENGTVALATVPPFYHICQAEASSVGTAMGGRGGLTVPAIRHVYGCALAARSVAHVSVGHESSKTVSKPIYR